MPVGGYVGIFGTAAIQRIEADKRAAAGGLADDRRQVARFAERDELVTVAPFAGIGRRHAPAFLKGALHVANDLARLEYRAQVIGYLLC